MTGYDLDESRVLKLLSIVNVPKLLKAGDTVNLKHYKFSSIINALVIDITENSITLKPYCSQNCSQNEYIFLPGEPVVLSLSQAGKYFNISGDITLVNSENPSEITIKIESVASQKNSRKSGRFYVSLASQIKKADENSIEEFSITKNLSLGGIKINSKNDLKLGETVFVSVNLQHNHHFTFKGKIVRKNDLSDFYEYGIEIVFISKSNQLTLFNYISQLETQLN